MPAVYAHYKFGKEVYRALPKDIRQMVKENGPAYLLGLHGPDLLFYYHPYGKNRVNQLGVRMHRESARFFFEKGRKAYQRRPNYVLLSYLCGFMCHFMLDSECHSYINRYMKEYRLGHLEIETDFDRKLLKEDGFDPVTHNCTRHLIRDLDTEEAIASVLENITADQVDKCILGFHSVIRLFQCPGAGKAGFLKGFFTLIGQKKGLGGLVMTGKENPKCQKSCRELEERMESAVKPAAWEIERYVRAIATDEPLSIRLNRDFE
ncbi:MAG TPA: zinc dependent phospholipase C family protein [Candidatus Merdisoma merdipullorum]|nr:zinc dependent phospholipase C family protein [Candidatus Merdisoma merdipullorum]